MKVLIATGGTGGHIFPALAVAGEIRHLEPDCRITFVGRRNGMEQKFLARSGDRYFGIGARPLPQRVGWRSVVAMGTMAAATVRCAGRFLRSKPDVCIGFGGYVSAPALLAARARGIPTAIHEQNAVPGKVNRWLARIVDRVFLSYGESGEGLPTSSVECSGMPVRAEVQNREARPEELGLEPNCLTLFFLGGSQGARKLCLAAVDCIRILSERGFHIQAIVQAGELNYPDMEGRRFPVPVLVVPFLEDMGNAYACADIVIARAGASSVAEIAANGIPAVFVPYPFAADDHQRKNIEPLVRAGAARLVEDDLLTGEGLADDLAALMGSVEERKQMAESIRRFARPGAAARIAREVLGLGRRKTKEVLEPQKEFGQG
jgi:UDP-N-acetylglucosamine--N-acetylmuramyl-(pentapeptide) pyrophosphoryl-undecaprenol N-acetylglucosamine transferase